METDYVKKILSGDFSDILYQEGSYFIQTPNRMSILDTNMELLKLAKEIVSININHSRGSEFEDFNSHINIECIIEGHSGLCVLKLSGSCNVNFLAFFDHKTNHTEGEFLGVKYFNIRVNDVSVERHDMNYLQHNGGFYV